MIGLTAHFLDNLLLCAYFAKDLFRVDLCWTREIYAFKFL